MNIGSVKLTPEADSHDMLRCKAWTIGYANGLRNVPRDECPFGADVFKREWYDGYQLAIDERLIAAARRPYK